MEDDDEMLGPQRRIKRSELVRIVAQCLFSLGYEEAARLLELESGITCDSWYFSLLEKDVLRGNWRRGAQRLGIIGGLTREIRYKALLAIFQGCYSEVMDAYGAGASGIALKSLGSCIDSESFHRIRLDLRVEDYLQIRYTGVQNMRRKLVSELKQLMPSPHVLPRGRLVRLVETALCTQVDECLYHVISGGPISLYTDHDCRDKFPNKTIQTLTSNEIGQEIKFIHFSNLGEYLASTFDNGSVLLWKVQGDNTVRREHEINSEGFISFVSWSPDDSLLLIQLSENYSILRLWDVEKATITHSFADVYVQSCAWLPSSRVFIGVCEQREIIHKINCETLETFSFDCKVRSIRNLVVTTRWGNWTFVWLSGDREIWIYSYPSDSWNIISETHDITSLSLSGDGNFLLVNIKNHEIHMWQLSRRCVQPMSYMGHSHQLCNVQSCFGGSNSRFIASGSEDSQVYIWNCLRSSPIAVLPGHSDVVKCVRWNPKRPQMLASLSDDCTIRIWGVTRSD